MLLCLILFSTISIVYADSEIIFPRLEIVNKTQANSIDVTEELTDLPKQKVSEIVLKSDEFTIFKQKQAGDYILLIVKSFDKEAQKFSSDFYKVMLSFHSGKSAEFVVYNFDNQLVMQDINVPANKYETLDLSFDGTEDVVIGYLGYSGDLPSFKVRAELPKNTIYNNGNYCELENQGTTEEDNSYKCYVEGSDGYVTQTYELKGEVVLAAGGLSEAVQTEVEKQQQEKLDEEEAEKAAERISEIDENPTKDYLKYGMIIGIVLLVLVLVYTSTRASKRKNDNDYGGGSSGNY